VKPYPLKYRKL